MEEVGVGTFAYLIFVLGVVGITETIRQVFALPNRTIRYFFPPRVELDTEMNAGDSKNANKNSPKESKGGLKFEVIYAEPTSPPPSKTTTPLSPKSIISVENIVNKLEAAKDRRRTIEAVKQQQLEEKEKHNGEVFQKRVEQNENFIQRSKALLEQKIANATEAREVQIAALLERLREHEKHIEEVRKQINEQMNEQTNQQRERLAKKLEQAQEKRLSMLHDLQVKQSEHLAHVKEIRQSKALLDAQNKNKDSGETVSLSG